MKVWSRLQCSNRSSERKKGGREDGKSIENRTNRNLGTIGRQNRSFDQFLAPGVWRGVCHRSLTKRVRSAVSAGGRVHAALRASGERHGRKRIARLMWEDALISAGPVPTCRDKESHRVPHLVDRDFKASPVLFDDRRLVGRPRLSGPRDHGHEQRHGGSSDSGAAIVSEDRFSGAVYASRGSRAGLIKLIWRDGVGLCVLRGFRQHR
jgi:hypothetical protein